MRIYAYGARKPFENANFVDTQMSIADSYHKVLIAIEHRRRKVVDLLYQRACPNEWSARESASKIVLTAIRAVRILRSNVGDMLAPDKDMIIDNREQIKLAQATLTDARTAEKIANQNWYAAKKKITPKLKKRLKMCDNGAYTKQKYAYNAAGDANVAMGIFSFLSLGKYQKVGPGLAWGTRLKLGESTERASKASLEEGSFPRFPKFDGAGFIAVQIQNGMPAPNVFTNKDTRFQIEIVDFATWMKVQGKSHEFVGPDRPKINGHRAKRQYAIARLRIGSNNRTPIWASWPISLHRSMPEKSRIKWAEMHSRKIGPRTEWQLLITLDDGLVMTENEDKDATTYVPSIDGTLVSKPGPILAVNLGWRNLQTEDGLRVAYAIGSDGDEEDIRVPPEFIVNIKHVRSLEQIRDKSFVDAKKTLTSWLEEVNAPKWLAEKKQWIDDWRSPKRLFFLLRDWKHQRFKGDVQIFDLLTAWLKHDRHLWLWESDEREKVFRMRKHFYRNVAAKWAAKYSKIVITDMDLRKFAAKAAPEDSDETAKVQRISQRLAAPSELSGALLNACSTRGTTFVVWNASYLSQTCNSCGIVFAFAARQTVEHTCICGAVWDQDANHCRNLLVTSAIHTPNSNRKTRESRWTKRKASKLSAIKTRKRKSSYGT